MDTRRHDWQWLGALAALGLLTACGVEEIEPRSNGSENFGTIEDTSSDLAGYVWDPEAMWFLLASCEGQPAPCPVDPGSFPGLPAHELTVLRGAQVTVIDPLDSNVAYPAPALSGPNGEWYIEGVPRREDVPFFAVAEVPAAGLAPGPDATGYPVAPATRYVPTLDLKPIATNYTYCLGQQTSALGDNGILEAVAKFLTAEGTPTVVNDLLNPERYAGVVVWWLLQPVPAGIHVPAFGSVMEASLGRVLNLDWAPPGALAAELQSARGFVVDGAASSSPIGLTVTLVEPADAAAEITFTAKDPVEEASQSRPWEFPSLPPMTVAPGLAMFGELPAFAPAFAIPDWACLPK